ncbi:type 2 periplasmic-binding domain-containing protein [Deinococcus puniceus]|uniref:substrate-binding domain-containing protein n=1 Tax=Deinococcus puniceus TaxID=1182568 RepID=UPI0018D4B215|nr:substrate-binding domain-containing protein [Deinococcus puniceus]
MSVGLTSAQTVPPLKLAGSTPPWIPGASFTALPPEAAFRELYGGRIDGVLGTLPGPPPPKGTGELVSIPVGLFPVSVVYSLPGVALNLDIPTLCLMLSGRVREWNHARLRALNPGAALPTLPVLVSARVARNGVSLAAAGACVKAGMWPRAWLKSNWVAGASFRRATSELQRADLTIPGVLMVLGPRDVLGGAQVAQLRSPGGAFVGPEALTLETGLGNAPTPYPGASPSLPAAPFRPLPPATEVGAYPLRGVVWLSMLKEQAYRGRRAAQAQALVRLAEGLQAGASASGLGGGFVGLPLNARPALRLSFQGKRVELDASASASSP